MARAHMRTPAPRSHATRSPPPPVVSVSIRVIMKRCWKQNGCGFFGSGGFIYFEIEEGQDTYEFFELLPMLLLGVLGGLLGSGERWLDGRDTWGSAAAMTTRHACSQRH